MRDNAEILERFLSPLRICRDYKPKFGGSNGVDISGFSSLYGSDSFYSMIGLASGEMFATHRAAGGMTSFYRQLGKSCELLLRDAAVTGLGLTEKQISWEYQYDGNKGKQSRSLDLRLCPAEIVDPTKKRAVAKWLNDAAKDVGLSDEARSNLSAAVFEIRQGYKSADSKRTNADLMTASRALAAQALPAMLVVSSQINDTIVRRYRNNAMVVLTGNSDRSPIRSTFAFARDVLFFDIQKFLFDHQEAIQTETREILRSLLQA